MGLSAFNAMRAREKAKAEALAKAGVEIHEVKFNVDMVATAKSVKENGGEALPRRKKTDAEKLKKKE